MVFGSESYSPPEQGVMWDFRQFYVEWTRAYMAGFSQAHFRDNYPEMFKSLKRWHSVVWGRAIKDFKEEDNKDKTFDSLINKVVELFNKPEYKRTYLMEERNAKAVSEFDESFNSIVVYIVWLMKKNKLFGSDTINRGLT